MALIVQKFGGSSVADRERIFHVARIIAGTFNEGHRVVAVVSAQGDTTDELLEKAEGISTRPAVRELDMLLATGEQISIALLCMALGELGIRAVSLTGWQAGFHTDRQHTRARIRRLDTERIRSELDKNQVVVVAGFQGLDSCGNITTLGRGGSDTSAAALACALGAQRCCIYTDVDGVYTADPRIVPMAHKLEQISFDEMLELAGVGAQVLHGRSVEMARRWGVPLEVLSSLQPGSGTLVTEVCSMEGMQIKSVAVQKNVSVLFVAAAQHSLQPLLAALNAQSIPVKQVLQCTAGEGLLQAQLLLEDTAAQQAKAALEARFDTLRLQKLNVSDDIACLSLVGSGLGEDAGALPQLLASLSDIGLYPRLVTAGEVRISVIIDRSAAADAVRCVHAAFFESDNEKNIGEK